MAFEDDYGVMYGSHASIFAWCKGLERPVELLRRPGHITRLFSDKRFFYDAGYPAEKTYSRENNPLLRTIEYDSEFSLKNSSERPHQNIIFGATIFQKQPFFLTQTCLSNPLAQDSRRHYYSAHLIGSDVNLIVVPFPWPRKTDGLDYRPGSLELASNEHHLFVASQNVTLLRKEKNCSATLENITGYLADFVHLASDGQRVLALSSHSKPHVEIRLIPENRTIAYWDADTYGFDRLAAFVDDTLVVGTTRFGNEKDSLGGIGSTSLFAIDLEHILDAELPVEVKPRLLLDDAFKNTMIYGKGNPILLVPRQTLDPMMEIDYRWRISHLSA